MRDPSLQVPLGPVVDLVQGVVQVLQRIGHTETQIAFAEMSKRRPRKTSDSGLLQQRVRQRFRFPASFLNVWKNIKRALRHAAREALNAVQSCNENISPLLELGSHLLDRGLISAQSFNSRDLGKTRRA